MSMFAALGGGCVVKADDATNISAISLSLCSNSFACVSMSGVASEDCDICINLSCAGASQLFPKNSNKIIPNRVLKFNGIKAGDFVVSESIDLRGFSEILPLDCTVSKGIVSKVCLYIELAP